MITFPEFNEKAKIRDLEFEIKDLSVAFFSETDKDPLFYNDVNILRDGSTLTEDEIQSLGVREKQAIVEKILDITNPERNEISEDIENEKK